MTKNTLISYLLYYGGFILVIFGVLFIIIYTILFNNYVCHFYHLIMFILAIIGIKSQNGVYIIRGGRRWETLFLKKTLLKIL